MGGELLLADLRDYKRLSHFDPVPLLGGEQAVLSPWRMALAYLGSFLSATELASHFVHRPDFRPVYSLFLSGDQMLTTSCGRLFDGVASLLGCVDVLSFEGQGGMMVESLAGQSTTTEVYTDVVQAENSDTLPTLGLFQEVYLDVKCGTDRAEISRKFINSLTALLLKAVEGARLTCGINRIVFSGGVFQNRLLLSSCLDMFAKAGFECLSHQKVPCNDGGLALGQLCVGAARQYRD